MPSTMICDIVTPEKMLYSAEASFVAVPASEGEIGFMPMRSPVMSTLRSGEVRVRPEGSEEMLHFAIAGGYVEADGHKVVVLANRAVDISQVDPLLVKERLASFEQALATSEADDPERSFKSSELSWYTLLDKLVSRN